jgi:hypothetical protein
MGTMPMIMASAVIMHGAQADKARIQRGPARVAYQNLQLLAGES